MSKAKIKIIGWIILIFGVIELYTYFFNIQSTFNYVSPETALYLIVSFLTVLIGFYLLVKKTRSETIIYWFPGIISIVFALGGINFLLIENLIISRLMPDSEFPIDFLSVIIYYLAALVIIVYGLIKGIQGIKNNRKIGWVNVILSLASFVISVIIFLWISLILSGGFD